MKGDLRRQMSEYWHDLDGQTCLRVWTLIDRDYMTWSGGVLERMNSDNLKEFVPRPIYYLRNIISQLG